MAAAPLPVVDRPARDAELFRRGADPLGGGALEDRLLPGYEYRRPWRARSALVLTASSLMATPAVLGAAATLARPVRRRSSRAEPACFPVVPPHAVAHDSTDRSLIPNFAAAAAAPCLTAHATAACLVPAS